VFQSTSLALALQEEHLTGMVSLSAIVEDGITHHQNGHRPPQHEQVIHEQDYTRDSQTFEPPTFSGFSSSEATPRGSIAAGKRSAPSSLRSYSVLHGTPAARTGPPASLTIDYTPNRHHESYFEESHESVDPKWRSRPPQTRPVLKAVDTEFRSALEYVDPEQQEAERETKEKRDKRRHSRLQGDGTWDMRRWFTESPKDEVPGGIKMSAPSSRRASGHDGTTNSAGPSRQQTDNQEPTLMHSNGAASASTTPNIPFLRTPKRSSSQPQLRTSFVARASGLPGQKWGRLRSLLPHIASQGAQMSMPTSAVTPHTVNITDELISGGLAGLMLQLWFDRDERDHRRVPIFLHRLRIRISDSLYPLSGHKAVFRIECEYANGAARWVIYRQLRDFLSLHTHYTVSNAYNRAQDNIPDFPRTSKQLSKTRPSVLMHRFRLALFQVPELPKGRRSQSQ
jgi:phospholipase D1/2